MFGWRGDCQSVDSSLCASSVPYEPILTYIHSAGGYMSHGIYRQPPGLPLSLFFSTRFTLNKLFWLFFPSMSKWNRMQPFNLHNKCDFNHNILHPTLIKYTVHYIILTVSAQSYHKLCNTESDTSNHCLQHLDGNLDISNHRRLRDENTAYCIYVCICYSRPRAVSSRCMTGDFKWT